jgi:F420-non-reducing hydrogenase iron-sulfur subunit
MTAQTRSKAQGQKRKTAAQPRKSAAAKAKSPAKKKAAPAKRKAAGGKRKAAAPETSAVPKTKELVEKTAVVDPKAPWEPRIVVFACNWCSYAGADTAGVSRIQQQPNFRMIRVMCSGRIQPAFVLRAFERGADGVLVSGCHFGDCHYIFGNERAVEQFAKTVNMVKLLGIEEGRLRLEWISAAEGARFAQVINEITDQVRELGPSPFSRNGSVEQSEEVA